MLARLRATAIALCVFTGFGLAQPPSLVPGTNVNMASGTTLPDGDPFLQRQNECSIAVSSRDANTLLAGCNDYRTVDIPGLFGTDELGDVWLGLFRSTDGGKTWKSTLHSGCPYNFAQCTSNPVSPIRGFAAAADPTVAAGTNGMFYMTGIAFNRGTNAQSAILFSRFIDNNNKENGNPIAPLGTSILATGTSGIFADKPWIATDIPRAGSGTCTVGGGTTGAPLQSFPAGNTYATWSEFTGSSSSPSSRIMLRRSSDCGATWSTAQKLSESNSINQGTVIAVDPATGAVYIAWRRIAASKETDAIMIAKSTDGGRTFTKAIEVATFAPNVLFDQPKIVSSAGSAFRARAFPALTIDANSRVYVGWSQRGVAGNGFASDARIVIGMSADGVTWNPTSRFLADGHPGRGHQLMPTMAFAGGSLVTAFYDNRDDQMMTVYTPAGGGQYVESVVPIPGGNRDIAEKSPDPAVKSAQYAIVFSDFISDATPGLKLRHTLDVRASQVIPGPAPAVRSSVKVSQYKAGSIPSNPNQIRQLQFNPPNFPMFAAATAGFIGDYITAAAQHILPKPGGGWQYNLAQTENTRFHLVWADNRDVRPPVAPATWADYTPVAVFGGASVFDPSQTRPSCLPNRTGMRNQNPYTADLVPGISASTISGQKPLNLQAKPRTFAVTVSNPNRNNRRYQLTIANQPAGGTASFDLLNSTLTTVLADVPARSTASRIVFVRSTNTKAQVSVNVTEVPVTNDATYGYQALSTSVLINPDIVNPDIVNPDIVNPDIVNPDIVTAELFTPTITNPDIVNPDIVNPDIVNPDIVNPDIVNPDIVNPDIVNPDIVNPDIVNPDIVNPDIVNPDIVNPDIVAGYSDYIWDAKNVGNTSSAYSVKLYQRESSNICQPGCGPNGAPCRPGCTPVKLQLIVHKRYTTPVAGSGQYACQLLEETQNPVIANITKPVFTAYNELSTPAGPATGLSSPSMALAPGETAQVTLRIFGPRGSFNIGENFAPVVLSQAENTTAPLFPLTLLIKGIAPANAVAGQPYTGTVDLAGAIEPPNGFGPVVWELLPAAGFPLPPGITFNSQARTITFTPAAAGMYFFKLRVTDNPVQGLLRSTELTLQINSVAALSATISNATLPPASPGQPYSVQLGISGGLPPYGWSVIGGGLDGTGLQLSSAGLLSGAIPQGYAAPNGTLSFQVQVKDSTCLNASCTITQTVQIPLQILVDGTAPVIAPAVTGTLGSNGWYTSAVNISWSVTDAESGILTSTGCGPALVSASTAGVTFQCSATNRAGMTSTQSVTIKLDTGAPAVTANISGQAGTNGWYTGDVQAGWNVVAPVSGIAATDGCGTTPMTSPTTGLTLTCKATSGAGVERSANTTIKLDKSPPVITPSVSGPAGADGWYTGNATVAWTVSDDTSGVSSSTGCGTTVVSASSAGTVVECSAVNGAGLSSKQSVTIRLDTAAPVITPVITGSRGANGWYTGPVTVSWNLTAPTSGITSSAGCAPQPLAAPTSGTTLTCTATSGAGTAASASVTVKIDLDAPQITPLVAGTMGSNGWYRSGVSINWNVLDSGSGVVASTGCGPVALADDNSGLTITCSATNGAGLVSTNAVFVKIDRTAPVITINTPGEGALYPLNSQIAASYACADALTGAVPCNSAVPNGAALDTATVGAKTLTVSAADPAGNTATVTRNYSVGYSFTGFGTPLGPAGTYAGEASLGKAIPVKFALMDGNNNPIQSTSAIEMMYAVLTGPPANNACPVALDGPSKLILYSPSANQTGSTQLRATTDGFIFNWDTPATGPGCYTVVVMPAGGGRYGVSVQLK